MSQSEFVPPTLASRSLEVWCLLRGATGLERLSVSGMPAVGDRAPGRYRRRRRLDALLAPTTSGQA